MTMRSGERAYLVRFVLLLFLTGGACASRSHMTNVQIRRMQQTRTFEDVRYDIVFRAFKTVLQEEGYIIKVQDIQEALIVAEIQRSDKEGTIKVASVKGAKELDSSKYEMAVNFARPNPRTVEARMTIQKLEKINIGGQTGEEVMAPEVYKSFYVKVKAEVDRRIAPSKKQD